MGGQGQRRRQVSQEHCPEAHRHGVTCSWAGCDTPAPHASHCFRGCALLRPAQDYQKGVDLIRDNYDWLMSEGVQLVFLGSGTAELEQALRDMENK